MLISIIGRPGSGKSLTLTYLATKFLKQDCLVASNLKICGTTYCPKPALLLEWLAFRDPQGRDKKVLIDEIQADFNARAWSTLDPAITSAIQQHRHAGEKNDLYFASQNLFAVEKTFRSLASYIWVVKKWPFGIFHISEYFPDAFTTGGTDTIREKASACGHQFFRGSKYYQLYDSYCDLGRSKEWLTQWESESRSIPKLMPISPGSKILFWRLPIKETSSGVLPEDMPKDPSKMSGDGHSKPLRKIAYANATVISASLDHSQK